MQKKSYDEIWDEVFDEKNSDIYFVVVMTNEYCPKCKELLDYLAILEERYSKESKPIRFLQYETEKFLLFGPTIFPAVASYKRGERNWEGHGLPPDGKMETIEYSIDEWMRKHK